MITRHTSTRVTKCRSCRQNIPAKTESYYVACVGASNTNVFVCKDCVHVLVQDCLKDFDSYDDFREQMTVKKLSE